MDILFMDGGELGTNELWDYRGKAITAGAVAAGFTGNFYYTGGPGLGKAITARDSVYLMCRFQGGNSRAVFYIHGNSGNNEECHLLRYGDNLQFSYYYGSWEGNIILQDSQVYRIEMYWLRNTWTGGTPNNDGALTVKVNGVIDTGLTKTNVRTDASNFSADYISFGNNFSYVDDCIIVADEWPGNVRIQAGVPNEAGGFAEWNPTPPENSNFECVNEIPSSDTDFVSVNVVDKLDLYGMSPLVETNPIESILGFQLSARAKLEGSATPKDLQLAILSGATYDYSSNKQVEDDTYTWYSQAWSLNPATGLPFTPAEINSLKIGIKSKTRP